MTADMARRPPTSTFIDWLGRELKARRMTQRQLAARSGIDHSTISRLLGGGRTPSHATVLKLARALGGLPPDAVPDDLRQGAARHPITHVEHALRADDRLSEVEVRQLMARYLALRRDTDRERQ
jgi:transcriptional regulator with XRE-family HTH domain